MIPLSLFPKFSRNSQGEPQVAKNFAVNGFKREPTVANYSRVRMTVDSAQWLQAKDEMLTYLRNLGNNPITNRAKVEVFLSEG